MIWTRRSWDLELFSPSKRSVKLTCVSSTAVPFFRRTNNEGEQQRPCLHNSPAFASTRIVRQRQQRLSGLSLWAGASLAVPLPKQDGLPTSRLLPARCLRADTSPATPNCNCILQNASHSVAAEHNSNLRSMDSRVVRELQFERGHEHDKVTKGIRVSPTNSPCATAPVSPSPAYKAQGHSGPGITRSIRNQRICNITSS